MSSCSLIYSIYFCSDLFSWLVPSFQRSFFTYRSCIIEQSHFSISWISHRRPANSCFDIKKRKGKDSSTIRSNCCFCCYYRCQMIYLALEVGFYSLRPATYRQFGLFALVPRLPFLQLWIFLHLPKSFEYPEYLTS